MIVSRFKLWVGIIVCVLGAILALPNLFSKEAVAKFPSFMPKQQVNLGLDLQGGSYLLLKVQSDVAIQDSLNDTLGELRQVFRKNNIGYSSLRVAGQGISIILRDDADITKAASVVKKEMGLGFNLTATGKNINLQMTEDETNQKSIKTLDQSIEIVRRRIDETGTSEPIIQRQGKDRILVQLPGEQNPERIKNLLGQTAKLSFHLVTKTITASEKSGFIPSPLEMVMPGDQMTRDGEQVFYVVERQAMVTGEMLEESQPSFANGEAVVSFAFNHRGAKKFGDVTSQYVGRPFAIILDNKVISAPVIREPILGGSGIISGSFTTQSANDLSLLLRAGALPAPLVVIEERTVGPGLGQDSIEAGKTASLYGVLFVIIFIFYIYRGFGLIAAAALMVNMILIFGALSMLQATLTLPGIAGIVLTIGMAVDANVLIFERMREDANKGFSVAAAINSGYQHAFSSVVDANITNFIAAFLLFMLGSGPVKGFAVTLVIGIIASVFSAMIVTRIIIAYWYKWAKPTKFPI